jgi:hypothetical protein
MVDRSHDERNAASRRRLAELVGRLRREELERAAPDGWTVGALLAHVAFWDGLVEGRWQHAARTDAPTPIDLDDQLTDLINGAAMPAWRAVEPDHLGGLVLAAAERVDALIVRLPDGSVAGVLEEGRPRLLDRSLHRGEHLAIVETALAGQN